MRFLIRVSIVLLSIWTILWVLLWVTFSSVDVTLTQPSAEPSSLADALKFFAAPAVGWILVIAAWLKTEQPFDGDDEEDGVWVGSSYLPNRADKD